MKTIDRDKWIESIIDSKSVSKQILRRYMKSQSARRYTQILDEYFISNADLYDGMPEIKKVLEDWLNFVSSDRESTKKYVNEFLRLMTEEKRQKLMSSFLDDIHNSSHTKTRIEEVVEDRSILTAMGVSVTRAEELTNYLDPLDEFTLISVSVISDINVSDSYTIIYEIENHASVTKEHIIELLSGMVADKIINEDWVK
jgi:hypothetical protein